jgi:hypothetical protein
MCYGSDRLNLGFCSKIKGGLLVVDKNTEIKLIYFAQETENLGQPIVKV